MSYENELAELLKGWAESYYESGIVEVDDATFNAKEEELRALNPNHPILLEVGYGYDFSGIDDKEKFEHPIPVGSIDKEKSIAAAIAFLLGDSTKNWTVSTKIDGNSIVCYYRNKKLWKVLTRGRGNIGIDRTAKFITCKTVAKEIAVDGYIAVRGEAAIPKVLYTEENGFDVSKSSRNAVAGAISRKEDYEEVFKYVDFIAYTFINVDTKEDIYRKYDWDSYFKIEHQKTVTIEYLRDIETFKREFKDSYEYEADGAVFRTGEGHMLALKFKDEKKLTKLLKIMTTIGVHQRLTPVAHFNEVSLCGARITKASLGSYSRAVDIGCWPVYGEHVVEIIRANEVIPYVTRTVSKADYLLSDDDSVYCPVCGSKGVFSGDHMFCVNPECENLNSSKLYKFASFFYPDGISNKVMCKVFNHLNITNVFDLFTIEDAQYENISLPSIGESTRDKIAQFFFKLSQPIDSQIIYQTFLKSCGKTFAKVIVEHGIKFEDCVKGSENLNSLLTIRGFHREIVAEIKRSVKVFEQISATMKVFDAEVRQNTKGTFCITGARFSGIQLKQVLDAGWSEDTTLKKTTTILVTKDSDSNSGKAKKAREYGIKVVSIEDFLMEYI